MVADKNMDSDTEDMISITDLLLILYRHRKLLLISFTVLFVMSLLFAWQQKPVYQFTQRLVLTHYYKEGKLFTVAPVDSLVHSIWNSGLLNNQHYALKGRYAIETSRLNDGLDPVVYLRTQGQDTPQLRHMFKIKNHAVYEAFKKLEQPYVSSFKKSIETEIRVIDSLKLESYSMLVGADSYTSQQALGNAIGSLAGLNQYGLYQLKIKFESDKEILHTLSVPHMEDSIMRSSPATQRSRVMMVTLGFFLSLFLSFLLVFVVNYIASVKHKLSQIDRD